MIVQHQPRCIQIQALQVGRTADGDQHVAEHLIPRRIARPGQLDPAVNGRGCRLHPQAQGHVARNGVLQRVMDPTDHVPILRGTITARDGKVSW